MPKVRFVWFDPRDVVPILLQAAFTVCEVNLVASLILRTIYFEKASARLVEREFGSISVVRPTERQVHVLFMEIRQ